MTKQKRYEKHINLLTLTVMILVIVVTILSLEKIVSEQQEAQLKQLSEVITFEVNKNIAINHLIESYQSKILDSLSHEILLELNNRDFSSITTGELQAIVSKYNVSGAALFKDLGSDILIEKSTSKVEVGLSTRKWGFWYTAFRQLMDDESVTLDKGTSIGSVWIGPRSKAYEQEGFFIFSYAKVPNQPYLLNLFIDDQKAFDTISNYDTNKIFSKLTEEASFIDSIAIINVEAWNNRFQHEHRSKLQDYTVEYGTYKSFTAEDTYYLNKANDLSINDSIEIDFKNSGKTSIKRYLKIADHEVMIIVLNKNEQNLMRMQIIITVIIGIILIWLLGYFVFLYHKMKFSKLLTLEKEQLKIAESYKQTIQILPSVVLRLNIVDHDLIVKHCEGKALKLIGINVKLAEHESLDKYLPSEYIELVKQHLKNMQDHESAQFEYEIGDHIFENKIEWVTKPNTTNTDPHSFSYGEIIILWHDITELRRSENQAKFMALHDHLTALPNRRYFKNIVKALIDEEASLFYLVFIDLDGFKSINDTAGHDIGDQVLIEISRRLKTNLTENEFPARMGGDEFAILYKAIKSKKEMIEKIQQLTERVSVPYTIHGHTYNISLSIGISEYPSDGTDYFTLLKKADIAMYDVKDTGKGNHKFYK